MGSISRSNEMHRRLKNFNKEDYKHLVGSKVVEIDETEVDYYILNCITLDSGEVLEVIYRWSSEEEDNSGIESSEESDLLFKEYLEKYILGNRIESIDITVPYDDAISLELSFENGKTLDSLLDTY